MIRGRIRRAARWRDVRWCAVDLELTGLDPRHDHIIAIGAAPIENGRVVLGQCRYTLVNTDRRSHPGAVLLHKLRVPDIAQAPALDDALEMLLETWRDCVPVFHAAAVEQAFLGPALKRRGVRLPPAADTEAIGRLWLSGHRGELPGRISLEALADGLGQRAEPVHHALGDALTTAQVFISLATLLDARTPQTVGTLLGAGELVNGTRRLA